MASVNDGGPRTSVSRPQSLRRPESRQGRLAGPSPRLDRRINAVRDDLADAALARVVMAPRYAVGVFRSCAATSVILHAAPDDDAVAVSQVLFGETFIVFEVVAGTGWAWGQCLHDGYVGWVGLAALAAPGSGLIAHWVAVPAAPVFAAPDIKARVIRTLALGSHLVAADASDQFAGAAGGFIHRRHIAAVTASRGDAAAVALEFVGTPYVWGGRTRDGIDCSGLTQAALRACGIFCPRDSDQQAAAFAAIDPADRRRGDLVAFPGHVGILADRDTLIHANAYWMMTLAEPLADVAARLVPTSFHRPPDVAATSC